MSDAFGDYLHRIGRLPLLTPAEELHLGTVVQEWLTNPTPASSLERRGRRAMDRMVTANLRLVVSVTRHYQTRIRHLQIDPLDVIQAGTLGLIRAVERYSPSRGYRFSTYAYWWIRQAVNRYLQEQSGAIRLPAQVTALAMKARFLQAAEARNLRLAELAARLGESEKRLAFVLRVTHEAHAVSLDQPMGGEETDACLGDLIPMPSALPYQEDYGWLHGELSQLQPIEQQVLQLRFRQDDPLSLARTAECLGLTKEKVQRLERQAFHKLRRRVMPMLDPQGGPPPGSPLAASPAQTSRSAAGSDQGVPSQGFPSEARGPKARGPEGRGPTGRAPQDLQPQGGPSAPRQGAKAQAASAFSTTRYSRREATPVPR
jgi:RNA polymerase sigma factor (sigma-70 family)